MAFFDKVMVGINKGVSSVSENSKLFVEKTKINSEIKEKENVKNKTAAQLGLMVYAMQKRSEIHYEQFDEMCAEIDNLTNDIEALKVKLMNLQSEGEKETAVGVQCKCGHYNKTGAKFCAKCGSDLSTQQNETKSENSSDSVVICGNCQNENKSGSKFCAFCGEKLESEQE